MQTNENRSRIRQCGRWLGLLACAFLANGCARSSVTTTVKADGSWTRSVSIHAAVPDEKGFNLAPKIEDVFLLPAGPEWKTTKEKKNDEMVTTFTRSLKAGETIKQDMAIKGGKDSKALNLVNSASVTEIAPGRWQYREVLHWQGTAPVELTKLDPEALAAIKNALPPRLATEANIKDTTQIVTLEFVHLLMGPNEPMLGQLFGQLMTNPDLAERMVMRRVGKTINAALEKKFGAEMTPEERLAITRKLVSSAFNSTQNQVKTKTKPDALMGPDKPADPGMLTPLSFIVQIPGKLVETNGIVDELTGEVYWSLYPEAAAAGDVTLTATWEVNK